MISIGFYISKDSLSVAELSLSAQQPEILFLKEVFFKDSQSEEEKQTAISKEIERIEAKHKGKNIRLCYSLSQNLVSNFFLEFPFKEKFKILKTLPFEVEDKTPFQMDKALFDARICKITNTNKSSVLVFVTPEENVKNFVSFLKPLKRQTHLLGCPAPALANLLEIWNAPLSKAQNSRSEEAYLYLGLESSLILIYRNGFLNHVSDLEWGVKGIIEEMSQAYKLEKEKAFEEFFTKAFILTQAKGWTKEQVFFSNLIKKQIQSLAPELKLLKMSLETKHKHPLSTVAIFGPGAMIKNLTVFLTDELDLPVVKLKQLAPFPNFDLQKKPLADIALGLALEGLKKSPYTGLNFLQSAKKTAFLYYPKKWKKSAFVFLFCFLVFSVYAFVRQFESSKALTKIEAVFLDYGTKIARLRGKAVQVESVKNFLTEEKEKQKDEKIVREQLNLEQPMNYLERIAQKLGAVDNWNLSLQFLKIAGRQVEMRGSIDSLALERFKTALQSLAEKPIQGSQKEFSHADEKKKQDKDNLKNQLKLEEKKEAQSVHSLKPPSDTSAEETVEENRSFFSYSFTFKEGL